MSKNKETIQFTLTVAFLLCVVCSVVVSTAAVLLRPMQNTNKELDFKRNILSAAGMLEQGKSIAEQFKNVNAKIVDLEIGQFSDKFTPEEFDQSKASDDPAISKAVAPSDDIAKIGRRENYAEVYFADSSDGQVLILPVRGYGLWSTLSGFIALKADYNTVAGLGFYDHKETPGLGGEVDNPNWKALWKGKKVYNEQGEVVLTIIKGNVTPSTPDADYKVDGLSGATLTSQGVDYLIEYWLGDKGYGPFIKNLRDGDIQS